MPNWYKQSQSSGIQVYHGSREPDIVSLKAHFPNYSGSLGRGVYVGVEFDTAHFYGKYVYELKTKFDWNEVFEIGEDNYNYIEELEESSMSTGESIAPFSFVLKGKTFYVTSLEGGTFGDSRLKDEILRRKLIEYFEDSNLDENLKKNIVLDLQSKYGDNIHDAYCLESGVNYYIEFLQNNGKVSAQATNSELDSLFDSLLELIQPIIDKCIKDVDQMDIEEIGLDEIGEYVQSAGYKAVYVQGIRARTSVNEEMLVFDENDLVMVRRVK